MNTAVTLFLLAGVVASIYRKKLTIPGAIGGGLLGACLYFGAGIGSLLLLAFFFIAGTIASAWKKKEKTLLPEGPRDSGRPRTLGQVFANGGVAAIAAACTGWNPPLLSIAIAGSLSAATADTLSSELGMIYGRRCYNILTGKPAQRGRDGVISLEGLLIGIAGSAAIDLLYILSPHPHSATPSTAIVWIILVLAGTLGNLVDSILGATLERKGTLGNNAVNFLNTLTGACSAALLYGLHFLVA